jgi:hypothetical protein
MVHAKAVGPPPPARLPCQATLGACAPSRPSSCAMHGPPVWRPSTTVRPFARPVLIASQRDHPRAARGHSVLADRHRVPRSAHELVSNVHHERPTEDNGRSSVRIAPRDRPKPRPTGRPLGGDDHCIGPNDDPLIPTGHPVPRCEASRARDDGYPPPRGHQLAPCDHPVATRSDQVEPSGHPMSASGHSRAHHAHCRLSKGRSVLPSDDPVATDRHPRRPDRPSRLTSVPLGLRSGPIGARSAGNAPTSVNRLVPNAP